MNLEKSEMDRIGYLLHRFLHINDKSRCKLCEFYGDELLIEILNEDDDKP